MLAAAAAVLTITVRVYDIYGLPPDQRAKALAVAADTLAQASVEARWIDCTRDQPGGARRRVGEQLRGVLHTLFERHRAADDGERRIYP